jgi:hypothetical protein
MAWIIKLNDISYTKVKNIFGKIAFDTVKGRRGKDYIDENAVITWEKLKNKCQPAMDSSSSENQFIIYVLDNITTDYDLTLVESEF